MRIKKGVSNGSGSKMPSGKSHEQTLSGFKQWNRKLGFVHGMVSRQQNVLGTSFVDWKFLSVR